MTKVCCSGADGSHTPQDVAKPFAFYALNVKRLIKLLLFDQAHFHQLFSKTQAAEGLFIKQPWIEQEVEKLRGTFHVQT